MKIALWFFSKDENKKKVIKMNTLQVKKGV